MSALSMQGVGLVLVQIVVSAGERPAVSVSFSSVSGSIAIS